jgi:trehalose 6-phosphate phosphatase
VNAEPSVILSALPADASAGQAGAPDPRFDAAPDASAMDMALPAPPLLHAGCALFIDFDGTLVSIAPRPQDVNVAPWVVPTLKRVHAALGGALAILSGRPLEQLDALLAPLRVGTAGVHGAQRRGADGRRWAFVGQPPAAVAKAAQALVQHHPQLLLETKPGSIAVHYRAAPDLQTICQATLAAALQGQRDWVLLAGHAVFEVKPRGISKASALHAFMAEPAFARRVPVAVGDDVTDEAAFAAALEAGGVAVKVGAGDTAAPHRLADPAAVCRWLRASAEALA